MFDPLKFPQVRKTLRDKFLLGAPVKINSSVPEHFIQNGELDRTETYWVHQKYTIYVGKKRTSRAAYIIKAADGRVIDNIEFFSSDLRYANG
jgi:cation transport regulator ChaC